MSVLVYAENVEGTFKKSAFELISYAKTIADAQQTKLIALTIGAVDDREFSQLATYGASRLVRCSAPKNFDPQQHVSILTEFAEQNSVDIIVFANNYNGRALAPRVAVRLNAALAAGMLALPLSYSPFVAKRKVYSGKAYATIELKTTVKVLTLNQNAFGIIENPVNATTEEFSTQTTINSALVVNEMQLQRGKVPVTEAERIVSGGRGMRGPENWHLIEELADALQASTACSKPVADIEWRPHDEHVGQTGKIVSPNLYLAIGISGAIQHLAGISSSKIIVAINNDAEAPIFEAADYGIIGDAFDVVPKLTEAIRKQKAD